MYLSRIIEVIEIILKNYKNQPKYRHSISFINSVTTPSWYDCQKKNHANE